MDGLWNGVEHWVTHPIITFGSAAIAVRHGLTTNHRLTASDVTATVYGHSKIQFHVHDT